MWSIIVHGGAGAIDDRLSEPHQAGCRRAVEAGRALLDQDADAIDAVCAAVRVLEDDPIYNAGIGSTVDSAGMVCMDAAVFVAEGLHYGAVGAVAGVRHPIDLARAVLEDGRYSLLVGPGAIAFARSRGIALCDPRKMEMDPSRSQWWFTQAESRGETVGAVCCDRRGGLAAATSTGGLLHKLAGRVGDSPIAGSGTYAAPELGAISTTGHGETILKTVLGYRALAAMAASEDPTSTLHTELEGAYSRAGGRAGAIAVLPDGRTLWGRVTKHMGVAWAAAGGAVESTF